MPFATNDQMIMQTRINRFNSLMNMFGHGNILL
jgi:hypothetical protein